MGIAHADSHDSGITGDAAAGEKVFRKCMACHEIGPDAQSKTGPILTGVVGRKAGVIEGFAYSDALKAAAEGDTGLVWTPENLDAFLTKPKDFLAGTKMTFAGLRKDEDRANVIAYLATFAKEGGS
ncbi:MAG: cytochrome c family protein [Paracoccaceae bacterium]